MIRFRWIADFGLLFPSAHGYTDLLMSHFIFCRPANPFSLIAPQAYGQCCHLCLALLHALLWHVMAFLGLHWLSVRAHAVRRAHVGSCVRSPSGGSLMLSFGSWVRYPLSSICLDGGWAHSPASCHYEIQHTLVSAGSQGMSETNQGKVELSYRSENFHKVKVILGHG